MSDTTRFQLHRSITFWTGVVLLLGFCFAWWYSWRDVVAFRQGSLTVMHASGGLTITKNPAEEKALEFFRMAPAAAAQDLRSSFFPKPYAIAGQQLAASGIKLQPRTLEQWHRSWIASYPRDVSLTFIPDWLMALVLLVPWAALIAWRMHRGAEPEPMHWPDEEQQLPKGARAAIAAAAAKAARAVVPPPVGPRRAALEARNGGVNWAGVVPRGAAVPGSPWSYSGAMPLTNTPMPFIRES